ncbi:MAG: hypothetical protein IJZ53_04785 [Tyzzerella sp.]|nr:hypothetical protein [Tyzzerella sp.]
MKKRILSILLAIVMVFTMIPSTIFATESENVYISVSYDGQFVTDQNGNTVAYATVPLSELATIDLNNYGLSDYLYDGDGDGNYDITAVHLYIYTHETILGGDFSTVSVSGGAGSIFFESGLFGFEDCNLMYYYNGIYPEVNGWGVTADQLVLQAGDFLDVAGYTSWAFYSDSATGFHYFADDEGNFTHNYSVDSGDELNFKLVRSYSAMGSEAAVYDEAGYEVYYGTSVGEAAGSVTTDSSGEGTITFPTAGTWYLWCDGGYGAENMEDIVSSPTCAVVTVTAQDTPRQPQDVSGVLNATMAQLAATVSAPAFGTNAGEWTVLGLARGEYFAKDHAYFADYYNRIVETVNGTASSVTLQNGALHKSKSTDNSRLIVALSAIGKDATAVGDWNLITPYDDFNWIKKQGLNGVIWALIALDTNDYQTTDITIRQQCIDHILSKQLSDGGWALSGTASDPDVTAMVLQALYPYKSQESVATAADEAFACLSNIQNADGTYSSFGDANSESCAQVIVASTTWGFNPDTDRRFVKNGKSVVDALLTHYIEEEAAFKHVAAGTANGMATDQACYALVAYNRFMNSKTALYDMSDVSFADKAEIVAGKPKATLGLPAEITDDIGKTFNATISLDQWDNTAGYKLIDFIMNVPDGLSVTGVTAGNRLNGGTVNYNLEADTGKHRVVYFDANNHSSLTVSGNAFPGQFFTVTFRVDSVNEGDKLNMNLSGMSIKLSSDSTDENAMIVVDTESATGSVDVVKGISYSAVCLYVGDDIDLIPYGKKAVAVSVVGIENATKLTYSDGTNAYEFKYSKEISEAAGVSTYVALVDASIDMAQFAKKANFTLTDNTASEITFGDANGDGVINAQDALAAVDTWLRKTETPSDDEILALNVNSDSRINTFDALGIVEAFVDGSEYMIVTKATTLSTNE